MLHPIMTTGSLACEDIESLLRRCTLLGQIPHDHSLELAGGNASDIELTATWPPVLPFEAVINPSWSLLIGWLAYRDQIMETKRYRGALFGKSVRRTGVIH